MLWKISFQIWQFWISIRRICQSQTLAASRNHLRSTSIMVGMALWGEDTGSCKGNPRSESRVGRRVGWHLWRWWNSSVEPPKLKVDDVGLTDLRMIKVGWCLRVSRRGCRKTILRRWKGNDFTDQFPGRAPHVVNVVYQCVSSTTHGKPSPKPAIWDHELYKLWRFDHQEVYPSWY